MSDNPASLYATFTAVNGLVLASTLLRLSFRLHIRRLWWEDAWAAATFISGTAFTIAQYISIESSNHGNYETGTITCWIASVFSTIAMCAVRLSILYSTIRVMPRSRTRTFARIVAIFLFIFCATTVALRSSTCTNGNTPNGTKRVTQKCIDGVVLVIFQVTTDFISDAILVILPLKFLWRVKLPRRQRRMILTSFSSSAIVSIFSLVHGISQSFPNNNIPFNLSLNLETTSALIVCNLLVLVTYVYRVIRKLRSESVSESDDSSSDDDFTTRTPPRRTTTEALTSVDLNIEASYNSANSYVSSAPPSHSVAAGKSGS